ncbi:MAG TPA: hypothetical protein VL992_15245 [Tepidisphaeraceae bacterium]|nr:hypothetical protein [Tepidisphaeraceae bacterium]
MALATVDADVLANPPETSDAANLSTDDMLSRLAGDEIDRLLAEAESAAPLPKPVSPIAPAPAAASPAAKSPVAEAAPAAEPDLAAELDSLLNVIAPPAAPTAAPVETAPVEKAPAVESDLAAELDSLLNVMESPAEQTAAPAETASVEAAPDEKPAVEAAPVAALTAADSDLAAELDSILNGGQREADELVAAEGAGATAVVDEPPAGPIAEAAASASVPAAAVVEDARIEKLAEELELGKSAPHTTQAVEAVAAELASKTPAAQLADAAKSPAGTPFYLLPLLWINLPVLKYSDSVRSALGKIAILTFLNAAAVLTYMLVFAHRH